MLRQRELLPEGRNVLAPERRPEPIIRAVRHRRSAQQGGDVCPTKPRSVPFQVDIGNEAIAELRRHIAATRFAAWEQPQVFSAELRAAFRTLR